MTGRPVSFSECSRQVRHRIRMSQEDLAYALRVSFSSINRWDNGKKSQAKLARFRFGEFCAKMIREGK